MKKILILFFFLLSAQIVSYSQTPTKYWVHFADKKGSPYSISNPIQFLSPRAIERRTKYNISITEEDLPVSPSYIKQVLALDSNIILFTQSKWLNGITIYSKSDSILPQIEALPFVLSTQKVITLKDTESVFTAPFYYSNNSLPVKDTTVPNNIDYGKGLKQVALNNIHWLHRMGYKGENINLGVMDGGFLNTDIIEHFDLLRNTNRLREVRNFVQPTVSPFRSGSHGNNVLSCIASYIPGDLVGTAPLVSVWLAQTEDGRSENIIEEYNWVAGIEWMDSAGCDVVNSSLGYTKFDDTLQVRKYEDLTGRISCASRAASIAASKGIVVCNSAGNEGNNKWHYIGSPADAIDIISVGAVDDNGKRAPFSSYGPTADHRVKPDAAAVGSMTYMANNRGKTVRGNGTSFSSPLMSGMIACLREAFPNKNAYQIINAVRWSGNQYSTPDSSLGYGISDMLKAYNILYNNMTESDLSQIDFQSYVIQNNKVDLTIQTTANKTIVITISLQSNPEKTIVKEVKLKSGSNIFSLSTPKISKENSYEFVLIDIENKHFTLGYEPKKSIKNQKK